jgi:hypothetical protein
VRLSAQTFGGTGVKPVGDSTALEIDRQTPRSSPSSIGLSQAAGSFLAALFVLLIPPSYLLAIATAIGLHFLGALPLHHWSFFDWIVAPARFVLLCYPLLIPGAVLLTAGLVSEEITPGTLILLAFVWGLFCGIIIAWFPDPAAASFQKGIRAAYAGGFAASFSAWVHVVSCRPR